MALLVGVLFLASASLVSAEEYPGPLVSMDWVQERLDIIKDPTQTEIRLVEVSKSKSYQKEHIPGAVNVKWSSEVFLPYTNRMVLDYAAMKAVMKKLGVTPDTHIVIYGDSLTMATRFYWTLKFWNVEKISVMDGTKAAWKKEGRPLTTEVPEVEPREYPLKYPPNGKIYAVKEFDVMRGLATGKVIFVDTRPKAYYDGKKFSVSKWVRSGHIPGAIQWSAPEEVSKDGKFLPVDQLKKMAEEKGITGDKEIIVYCNTGVRSSTTWFILSELLGYENVKNYDGSLREWANEFYLPMEPDNFNIYKDFPKTPLQELKEATDANAEKVAALEKEVQDLKQQLAETKKIAEAAKAEGKGVCGPTSVALLAALPLAGYALRRRFMKKN
ncbi:MAG: sulfurtransferase [Euryarchaeota archaeon]|nr:sulfurtransferase [Euryarchaeota archaeon]